MMLRRPAVVSAAVAAAVAGVIGMVALPAPQPAVAAQQAAQATTYSVDPVHSTIVFSAMYLGQSPFYGMFNETAGTLTYAGDPASLAVDISAPLSSLDTHNEQRDGHLRSPEWFNAAEHPQVTFTGRGASKGDDGTMTMQGELTLNGQTKPVTVTLDSLAAGQTPRGQRIGIGGSLVVQRSDFGVTTMLGDDGIGDEITLRFGVQGVAE